MIGSIIVYRNPLEAAIWGNGMLGPVLLLCLLTVIMVYFLFTNAEKIIRKHKLWKHEKKIHNTMWGVTAVFFLYGLHYIATT